MLVRNFSGDYVENVEISFEKTDKQESLESYIDLCRKVYDTDPSLTTEDYLYKNKNESDAEYLSRTKFAPVGMHFRTGITAMRDIIFKKNIQHEQIGEENATEWEKDILYNINTHTSTTSFAKEALMRYYLDNEVYVLTYLNSTRDENMGKNEEQERGVRGESVFIDRDRIIDAFTKESTTGDIIQMCYYDDYLWEDENRTLVTKRQYHVIKDIDGVISDTIYRENDGGYYIYDELTNLDIFPVTRFKIDNMTTKPALYDVAKAQVGWMTQRSEMRSFVHKTGFPIMVVHGMQELMAHVRKLAEQNKINIGICDAKDDKCLVEFMLSGGVGFSVGKLVDGKASFKVEYIELSGDNYKNMAEELERWRELIVSSFAQIMISSKGNKSVEESKNEVLADISVLASNALDLEVFINKIHSKNCIVTGCGNNLRVNMNKEFLEQGVDYKAVETILSLKDDLLNQKGVIENLKNTNIPLDLREEHLVQEGYGNDYDI